MGLGCCVSFNFPFLSRSFECLKDSHIKTQVFKTEVENFPLCLKTGSSPRIHYFRDHQQHPSTTQARNLCVMLLLLNLSQMRWLLAISTLVQAPNMIYHKVISSKLKSHISFLSKNSTVASHCKTPDLSCSDPDLPQLSSLKCYLAALGSSFSEVLVLDCFWLEEFSKQLQKINVCSCLQD